MSGCLLWAEGWEGARASLSPPAGAMPSIRPVEMPPQTLHTEGLKEEKGPELLDTQRWETALQAKGCTRAKSGKQTAWGEKTEGGLRSQGGVLG